MKQLLIVAGWLTGAFLTLFVSVLTIRTLSRTQELPVLIKEQVKAAAESDSSLSHLSGAVKGVSTAIQTGDARPIIIAAFLETHNSPLKPYDYFGEVLTKIADKYNMYYRLLPSIAMQESNLCKVIPVGTYNCLGLGIHSQGTWGFDSFEQNFDTAAKILRENYIDEGLISPDDIQDKYTPSSNGSWEFAVNQFMDQLETAEF